MALLDQPNLVLTPHVAWANNKTVQTLADQLDDNIDNYVVGWPSNVCI